MRWQVIIEAIILFVQISVSEHITRQVKNYQIRCCILSQMPGSIIFGKISEYFWYDRYYYQ